MSGFWTVYLRELAGLFLAPLAWVVLCLALFVNGSYFTFYLEQTNGDVGESLLLALGGSTLFWGFLILLPPLLTMRMISEEARSGLLEFLLTAPVSDGAVVLAKLAASTTLMLLLWSSSLAYGLALGALGAAPDWAHLACALLGAVLASAFFSSIGLVASACTSTPLLAAFLAIVANIALLSVPLAGKLLKAGPEGWVRGVLRHADVIAFFQASFMVGALDTKHLAFFLAWTGFCVFLATRLLETRRWR